MKRALSLILSLVMVLSMLPAQGFAESAFTVTFAGTNAESSGAEQASAGANYSAFLSAAKCFTLTKEDISVTIGGTGYPGFEYSSETGELIISGGDITGNIVITVSAKEQHTAAAATQENRVQATCVADGSYDSVVCCSVCTKELSREKVTIPATGIHSYTVEVPNTRIDATCTRIGYVTRKCATCEKTEAQTIPVDAEAHSWDEGKVTKAATCSAKGVKTYTCSIDPAHTKTEEIPVDGTAHEWDEGAVTKAATCTATGVKTYTCKHNEAHTRTEEVAIGETAHEWDEGTVTTPATCTQTGVKTYVCKHNEAHTRTEEVAIVETAHEWDEGTVTTPATCTQTGVKTYVCKHNEAHTRTEELAIEETAHQWGEAVYQWSADGKTCDAERSCTLNAGHTESAGASVSSEVTVEATCGKNGITTYTAVFDAQWAAAQTLAVEDLPATGVHTYENHACTRCENGIRGDVDAGGVLTITGFGEMENYASAADVPWYASRTKIKEIRIGDGVTSIGDYALAGLANVKSLTIPGSVKTLGAYALSGSGFQAVELPNGLTAIPEGLLSDCKNLNTVVIPGSVTEIGKNAFQNCVALYGISLPEGLTSLGEGAFRKSGLNNIKLSVNLTEVGEFAFAGINNLTKLTIPSNVTTISANAFNGCKWLDTVYIDSREQALDVEENAFSGCTALKTVYYTGDQELINIAQTGNSKLISALKGAGEEAAGEQQIPVREVHILDASANADLGFASGAYLDGKIILVDLNSVKTIQLCYKTNDDANYYPEITWNPSDKWSLVTPSLGENGEDLVLQNIQPGDMTVFAQNYNSEIIKKLGYNPYTYTTASVRFQFRKLEISGDSWGKVMKGQAVPLTATVLGDGTASRSIVWSLDCDASVAVIDSSGVFTGYEAGKKVTVTARTADGGLCAQKVIEVVTDLATSVGIRWAANGSSGEGNVVYYDLNDENAGKLVLTAYTAPEGASNDVTWTSSDKKLSYGQYTENKDGSLTITPTGKTGSITLTATTADGSKKSAKVTVKIVKLAREIGITNGKTELRGGEKLTLGTSIDNDKTLTSRSVVWELPGDSEAFASITNKGVLTTRQVPERTEITVKVSLAEKPETWAAMTIALYPAVDQVQIKCDDKVTANNATITADRNGGEVTLKPAFEPNGCMEKGIWTLSDKKGTYAEATENADGSLTLKPTGKAGTVTVTLTAADGSGKNAKLKVKFAELVPNFTISAAAVSLRSAEKLQLTLSDGLQAGKFAWTTSDAAVATVSSGKVTAKTVYEKTLVTITATAKDGSSRKAEIVLAVLPGEEKTLGILNGSENVTAKTITVDIDRTKALDIAAKLYDSGAQGYLDAEGAELTSGTRKVADFGKDGKLEIRTTGKTVVTARYTMDVNGKVVSKTVKVTVNVVRYADKVELSGSADWLLAGKSQTLKAALTSAQGKVTDKTLVWESSNPAAAAVDARGKVTAQKIYTREKVTITASTADGQVKDEFELTVYPAATTLSIMSGSSCLNNRTITARVGDTLDLTAIVYPYAADGMGAMQDVDWSISSRKAASFVAEDVLLLQQKGTVTIKATTRDGTKKTVSFKIIVKEET